MAQPITLNSKTVKSKDGTDIFAEATGDPTKQAIVFVHGLACSGLHFDALFAIPKLREDLYLV
jgi:pimeloyl-ACP methyl ester carboxylesterase